MKAGKKENLTLTDLPHGQAAHVKSVRGSGRVAKRLMELGVIPGVALHVVKSTPFGDPIEVRLRGYSLAMRRSEAEAIEIAI